MGGGDNGVARGNIQQAHAALSVEHTPESSSVCLTRAGLHKELITKLQRKLCF